MEKEYPIHLYLDIDGVSPHWVAEYLDLPGCIGVGDTKQKALEEAEIFKNMWLESAAEIGRPIPEPSDTLLKDFSGKLNIRIPKSLHRNLSLRADEEGVSLNSLIMMFLSKGVVLEHSTY